MFTLQMLGGCTLTSGGEPVTGPAAQRRRLAFLALLASSPNGLSRDKLVAFFWPEADRERARHFLADSVFTLRKSLGKDALLTTASDDVRINPEVITADVVRFEELATAGELTEAVALYRGPFLDGFFISDAPEFERWVDGERDRLARRFSSCLEQLASSHETTGEWATAAEEWRRLAAHDPYNSRVAVRTMRALDVCGDVAGALRHAQNHQARIRDDLGLESDPAVVELADSVRTRSTARLTFGTSQSTPAAKRPSARPAPARGSTEAAAPKVSQTRRRTLRYVAVPAMVLLAASALVLVKRAPSLGAGPTGPEDGRTAVVALGDVPRAGRGIRTRTDEARDLYAQGRYVLTQGQFDPAIHKRALELFGQAIERDSSFALAYAGMADVYNHADDPARAKEAALRALALDSSIAEAHTALAYVLGSYEHRWGAADSALHRAIAIDPRYVLAHLRRANMLAAQGRLDEAEKEVERAREIQPESFVVMLNRGMMAELGGRWDEAIARYQAALALDPGRVDAQYMLTRAYWAQGRYAQAQEVMRSLGNVSQVAAMSGNPDTMARTAPVLASSGQPSSMSHAAAMYVRLGRNAEAVELLERLYERRHNHLALVMQRQTFAPVRDYPPFQRLLRKLNVPVTSP
jgi:DNA-binding SARP family transcriptional activator